MPPPESPRTDFALDVVMLDTRKGTVDPVVLQPENGLLRLREGQSVRLRIKVGKPAYVGVWSVDADGTAVQLFPEKGQNDHQFTQGEERLVPEKENFDPWRTVGGSFDWVWVQASTRYWEPEQSEHDGPFVLFKAERDRERWQEQRRGLRLRPKGELAEAVLKFRVEPR
jgi:hypothetical protein